ncbi:hypothetical protein Tery_2423 [Trichodesmium erythraeum IMS101]|uniref:Uncharacterized protein n=1 Tax=Trichodesmium erythraeum (strain IMS101) TaxID=203124 RepID=Q112D4_TRIEI|nr:hypothetical protein [Trichodesmium erythraeum GBRTRLIN201]
MSKKLPLPPPPPPPPLKPELEESPGPKPGSKKKFTPIRKLESSSSKFKIPEWLKVTHIPEGLVTIGLVTMLGTLWFYKTTICEYQSSYRFSRKCNYNIGLISHKNNLITVGGFLFLGGCALFNSRKD